jgi:enoyl-CoA hydratase/carnithine racemase
MNLTEIAVRTEGRVLVITLGGASLSRRSAIELESVLDELIDDRSATTVIVDSGGPDFCLGCGPDLVPSDSGVDPPAKLAQLRVPVIAVVNGRCNSVGLELALAADIRLAGHTASFSMDDVAIGRLPAWGGTQRLSRVVGIPTATAMLLGGEVLTAEQALAKGLVYQVDDDPSARASGLAAIFAERGPLALEFAKEAIMRGAELPLHHALRLEADFNHLLQNSEDRGEGLGAFFEKRPPRFEGR